MDSSKPTFIKNRLGDLIDLSADASAKKYSPYIGSFKIKSVTSALKYFSITEESVESYFDPNAFMLVKTCQVTLNDIVYPHCPVYWFGSTSGSVTDLAQGLRVSCCIGNPKFMSEFWKLLAASDPGAAIVDLEDNGIPFLFDFDIHNEKPLGSNFYSSLNFSKGDIVNLRIAGDTARSLINTMPSQLMPIEMQGIVYDVKKNTILSRAAYQATGANSAAFGYATNAQGANQFVVGQYNDYNTEDLFIVGNGGPDNLSNAFAVDKAGNATANAVILSSPNGTKFKISVNDDGTLNTAQV
jgi:hypothetical protein